MKQIPFNKVMFKLHINAEWNCICDSIREGLHSNDIEILSIQDEIFHIDEKTGDGEIYCFVNDVRVSMKVFKTDYILI